MEQEPQPDVDVIEESRGPYKGWHDVTRKQHKRRSDTLWVDILEFSEKQGK